MEDYLIFLVIVVAVLIIVMFALRLPFIQRFLIIRWVGEDSTETKQKMENMREEVNQATHSNESGMPHELRVEYMGSGSEFYDDPDLEFHGEPGAKFLHKALSQKYSDSLPDKERLGSIRLHENGLLYVHAEREPDYHLTTYVARTEQKISLISMKINCSIGSRMVPSS